jgi:hypothetical protein
LGFYKHSLRTYIQEALAMTRISPIKSDRQAAMELRWGGMICLGYELPNFETENPNPEAGR